MESGIVENGAQTTLFSQPADRGNDIRLIEVVSEDIDFGPGVSFTVRDEIKQTQPCVGTKPNVLRFERFGVKV